MPSDNESPAASSAPRLIRSPDEIRSTLVLKSLELRFRLRPALIAVMLVPSRKGIPNLRDWPVLGWAFLGESGPSQFRNDCKRVE